MIESKWEWIERQCRELGADECADIAHEIEEVLKRLYGDTVTKEWEKKYNMLDVLDAHIDLCCIRVIANTAIYCIACEEESNCINCGFARETGSTCGGSVDSEGLYSNFMRLIRELEENEQD